MKGTSINLLRTMITSLIGGCLISLTFYLFLVILGLDPGIHLPVKVSMDAASSAA